MKSPLPIGIAASHVGPLPGVRSFRELSALVAENRRLVAARADKRKAAPTRTVREASVKLAALKRELKGLL